MTTRKHLSCRSTTTPPARRRPSRLRDTNGQYGGDPAQRAALVAITTTNSRLASALRSATIADLSGIV